MSFQGFRSLAGQLVLCGPLMLACMFSGAGEAPAGSGEIKAGDRVVTILNLWNEALRPAVA